MTQKETIDIGLSLTILLDSIINKDLNPDEVANTAVTFAQDILMRYPDLRKFVDDRFSDYLPSDEGFSDSWNKQIQWIQWEREMLSH